MTYEGFKNTLTGMWTLSQAAIDAGFVSVLMAYGSLYPRGIYDFDGTNYNLQLDLTDFSAAIAENTVNIAGVGSRLEVLENKTDDGIVHYASVPGGDTPMGDIEANTILRVQEDAQGRIEWSPFRLAAGINYLGLQQ